MAILFVIGLILLSGAFFAAVAETVAHGVPGAGGWLLSAYDVAYALWPGKLVVLQIKVEALHPLIWDPVLTTIMAFPGWLVLGVPGGVLFWWAHPKRRAGAEDDAFDEDSLYLFDRLAEQAAEDGYGDGDDLAPSEFVPSVDEESAGREDNAAGNVPPDGISDDDSVEQEKNS